MRRIKVGTITLALGLIIFGLALFANNFTDIVVKDIYKYWPVLLIGVGIEMFVYMIIYRQEENLKLRFDGLFIAFIIVAIIFGSNFQGFGFKPEISFNPFKGGNNFIDNIKYKGELKESIIKDDVSKGTKLDMLITRNSFGDVKLQPYDQAHIKVVANVTVKYNDENAAREYMKDVVKIEEGLNTEIFTSEYNGINRDKYARAQVDFIIYVPQGINAEVHNSFGDILAQGVTKNVTINSQHGDVTVKGVGGNVSIKNSFGDIEAKDIGGKLDANNQHGAIEIDYINGSVDVETGFGDLDIGNVSGQLTARNNYGKIIAKNIKGDAQIKTSFGDIDAQYIDGNTIINDNNGSIEAKELKGNVEIRNSFGEISYKSSNSENASIFAKTSFGKINTNLPINISKAINEQTAQGKLGDGKYRIELVTSNGEIDLE